MGVGVIRLMGVNHSLPAFDCRHLLIIIIIIIYHYFLSPPKRGSIINQITHTQPSKIHPLANILDTCSLIISSCAIFAVYLNRIMYRHPTPLQVITARVQEGGPKEYRAKQKWPRKTHLVTYICTKALHSFLSFVHCHAITTVIPPLPRATFTPSIEPNLSLPRTRPPLTSAKEDIDIEQQLYEIVRGKNFALNCLS